MKSCYLCKEVKPLDAFYTDKSRASNVSSRCKVCENKRKTPDRVRAQKQRQRERDEAAYLEKDRVRKAKKRHVLKQAQPAWADDLAISYVYMEAAYRRRAGEDVVVDHIIPLRGELVCGLHVANNLQILTNAENYRKNNFYVIE